MSKIREITDRTHYQTFDFIGGNRKDSSSGEKYKLSKLDLYDLKNKSVLDVGCNAGYFLFKLLNKNSKMLVGIDNDYKYLDTAHKLNNEYFKSNIKFIHADFFDYNFENKFDLIICFSTFHYFINKQEDFIEKCFNLLNDRGILLLEMEEYPENIYPIIDNKKRPADRKRYNYPNYLKLKEFVSGKFNVVEKYISIKQSGSLYDRYFYKLRKITVPGKRKLEGEYKKSIILVSGNAGTGKSTICSELLKENIDYVSLDIASIQPDHNIKEIIDFTNTYGDESLYKINILCNKIKEENYEEFIDYFFNKYILENDKLNILVDGYLFLFDKPAKYFVEKCKKNNFIVWIMYRIG